MNIIIKINTLFSFKCASIFILCVRALNELNTEIDNKNNQLKNLEQKYIDEIYELKNVDEVTYDGTNMNVLYQKGKDNLITLMDYLKSKKIKYNTVFVTRPTLNDVFLELTGKELRD